MADEDDSQKTEDPTSRKLGKAREEGQVAQSQEIKSWAILVGGAGMVVFLAPGVASTVATIGRRFIESSYAIPTDFEHLRLTMVRVLMELAVSLAPVFGLFIVVALAASMGQVGLMWSPSKIEPKLDKVNPMSGFKKIFSMQSLVEFLKGILKLSLVSLVAFGLAIPMLTDLRLLPGISPMAALHRIHEIAIMMALASAGVMTVIAALDYVYQRYNFTKQMRMSKQEVKEEHKQTEGDPQVKARIRSIRMDRARKRMMSNVPKADVVITNPTHLSVAISYRRGEMDAPQIVAKGADNVAMRIREIARENKVPLVENVPVARALFKVPLGGTIPEELFQAVAEILAYVYNLKGMKP